MLPSWQSASFDLVLPASMTRNLWFMCCWLLLALDGGENVERDAVESFWDLDYGW